MTTIICDPIKDNLQYFIDRIRLIRNELLTSTDKYLLSDFPISTSDLELVKKYRNDLRNYMNTCDFNSYKIYDLPIPPPFINITIVPTSIKKLFPNIMNNISFDIMEPPNI
jgi:hypothetical protein